MAALGSLAIPTTSRNARCSVSRAKATREPTATARRAAVFAGNEGFVLQIHARALEIERVVAFNCSIKNSFLSNLEVGTDKLMAP